MDKYQSLTSGCNIIRTSASCSDRIPLKAARTGPATLASTGCVSSRGSGVSCSSHMYTSQASLLGSLCAIAGAPSHPGTAALCSSCCAFVAPKPPASMPGSASTPADVSLHPGSTVEFDPDFINLDSSSKR